MEHLLNPDCWYFVLEFIRNAHDHNSLFQLLLVSKASFRTVAPILYRKPTMDFKLHYKKIKRFEEHLKRCIIAAMDPPRHGAAENFTSPTIKYYDLVQEMHDPYYVTSLATIKEKEKALEKRRMYCAAFGAKVKEVSLSVLKFREMNKNFVHFENLHTLTIKESFRVFPADVAILINIITRLIRLHRKTFPDKLQKVSYAYKITPEKTNDWLSDPRLMLAIREAMDGQWSTDTVVLRIPAEEDAELLKVLKDVDLPKQLRTVEIRYIDVRKSRRWIEPLKKFLSRCRKLDSIKFYDVQPDTLGWALDEHQAKAGTSTATEHRVEWKQLKIHANSPGKRRPTLESEIIPLEYLWKVVMFGFGHCLEVLNFFVHSTNENTFMFRTLSMPRTIHLPKLRSLGIEYPTFGEIDYTGVENLYRLIFKGRWLEMRDSHWHYWKRWTSLVHLKFDAPLEPKAGFFMLTDVDLNAAALAETANKLADVTAKASNDANTASTSTSKTAGKSKATTTTKAKAAGKATTARKATTAATERRSSRLKSKDAEEPSTTDVAGDSAVDSTVATTGSISDGVCGLPLLRTVSICNRLPTFGLDILLIAPKVSRLYLRHSDRALAVDFFGTLFKEANRRSLEFSNLKSLHVIVKSKMDPEHFAQLMGCPGGGIQYDMFPALTDITLGILQSTRPEDQPEIQEPPPAARATATTTTTRAKPLLPSEDAFMQVLEEGWKSGRGRGKMIELLRVDVLVKVERIWKEWCTAQKFEDKIKLQTPQ